MAKRRKYRSPYDCLDNETPEYATTLAGRRTAFMLEHMRLLDFDLRRLLISAYLQGVNDTVQVAMTGKMNELFGSRDEDTELEPSDAK